VDAFVERKPIISPPLTYDVPSIVPQLFAPFSRSNDTEFGEINRKKTCAKAAKSYTLTRLLLVQGQPGSAAVHVLFQLKLQYYSLWASLPKSVMLLFITKAQTSFVRAFEAPKFELSHLKVRFGTCDLFIIIFRGTSR